MKLLLTHGYFLSEDAKEQKIMKPYAPLGLLYLCSHLRAKGFDVEVYDSTFGARKELYGLIDAGPPAVLGIYANLMTRGSAVAIAERARAAGWTVVLGGPEPLNYPEEYLDHGADVVVCGEGELVLEALLGSRMDRQTWPGIAGLAFRAGDGRLVRTGSPRLIADLDAQPWPARDAVDIPRYLKTWRDHHGQGSLSLITANWCSHSVYGHTHRRRSPTGVVDELEFLLGRYQPDMLWMADDVFTIRHGWLYEYAAEMKARGIRIPFECITRADRIDARVAAAMAELGCFRIWIGSESGSQKILDAMQRGVTVEQVRRAVSLCRENGIQTGMFLMWGYDGEELSDIEATIDHVKQCRPDVFFTTVSYPIKGTPYHDKTAERLVSLRPWKESSDREIQVRARHSRRFYQYADQLLRGEMADEPDAGALRSVRAALYAAQGEVEA
ncbi:MAG: radical SAM protein [Acidobacteria bacterium]|nr:radical SAM protein [Acidobacteriota bacterium]